MPVATARLDPLTPMLRNRLETSLPPEQRTIVCKALGNLLDSVCNLEAPTVTPPPSDRSSPWPMAQLYLRLVAPVPGSQAGPLSAGEHRTLHLMHYLHEVAIAPPLQPGDDPSVSRPQSQIHARMLNQLRHELALLDLPDIQDLQKKQAWRELAVIDIAPRLLQKAERLGFQPNEVRVLGTQHVAPAAGLHQGGLKLTLVAWNGAAPPDNPNVWDPNNPLGNEPDLLLAPLQMDWTGLTPLPPA